MIVAELEVFHSRPVAPTRRVAIGNSLLPMDPPPGHGATLLAAWWDDLAPVLATNYDKVNLLEVFGPQGGLIVTYLMLAAAMLAVIWWEKHFFARKASITQATLLLKEAA